MDYATLPNIATEQLTASKKSTDQFDRHHGGHVHGFDSQGETVIIKRFSLDNQPRMTLESIGANKSPEKEFVRLKNCFR